MSASPDPRAQPEALPEHLSHYGETVAAYASAAPDPAEAAPALDAAARLWLVSEQRHGTMPQVRRAASTARAALDERIMRYKPCSLVGGVQCRYETVEAERDAARAALAALQEARRAVLALCDEADAPHYIDGERSASTLSTREVRAAALAGEETP